MSELTGSTVTISEALRLFCIDVLKTSYSIGVSWQTIDSTVEFTIRLICSDRFYQWIRELTIRLICSDRFYWWICYNIEYSNEYIILFSYISFEI